MLEPVTLSPLCSSFLSWVEQQGRPPSPQSRNYSLGTPSLGEDITKGGEHGGEWFPLPLGDPRLGYP